MRAVVSGGTGLVGAALLRELSAMDEYESVVSFARRPHEAPPKVEVRDLEAQMPEADVAFCALGTTLRAAGSQQAFYAVDHALVLRFARAARERGIRSFHVVSALGASERSRVFYNRVKGEMERDVRALGFPSACAYRPSLLHGARREPRPGERVGLAFARLARPLLPARLRAIPAGTVARAMARHAAARPEGWHVHLSDEIWRLAA